MPEPDDRASIEILKAPLSSTVDRNEFKKLEYRLMEFAVALALLVMLTPTWLTTERQYEGSTEIYSGIGMIDFSAGRRTPMGALGTFLFLVYLVLALSALVYATGMLALARGVAGLAVTILILLSGPGWDNMDWTGAPLIALGLWVVAVVVAGLGLSATRT